MQNPIHTTLFFFFINVHSLHGFSEKKRREEDGASGDASSFIYNLISV